MNFSSTRRSKKVKTCTLPKPEHHAGKQALLSTTPAVHGAQGSAYIIIINLANVWIAS